jgi:hypothetical protein
VARPARRNFHGARPAGRSRPIAEHTESPRLRASGSSRYPTAIRAWVRLHVPWRQPMLKPSVTRFLGRLRADR